jgi:hypothetical protein
MDHSKSMNFAGVGIFPDHEGGDFLPSTVGVGVSDGVIQKVKLALHEASAFGFKGDCAWWGFSVGDRELFQVGFVVT